MEQDNTYIRFDWAMKHMLRDKANFGILEGLVSVLLGEEVKIDEILESEGNQESERDKFNRVDIKARNSKGHIILVEVQLTRQLYYLERILYGVCKTITEHISIGDKYDQIKKVYSISILYCDYGRGDDYVYHGETRFPEYYLVRVNHYNKIPESPLDEWMTYLKTGKIKEDTRVPGLQEVKKKLQYLSMTPQERSEYDAHMDSIMVQNDVLDTARIEERQLIAQNLISMGMTDEVISTATGLPADKVRTLREQL